MRFSIPSRSWNYVDASDGDRVSSNGSLHTRRHSSAAPAASDSVLQRAAICVREDHATQYRPEVYWEDNIRGRFECQTVRTVCRLPRIRRFSEARLNRYTFEDYLLRLSSEERQSLTVALAVMRALLIRTLAPGRVVGLGGLMECQRCGRVGARLGDIRHRNCIWLELQSSFT